LQIFFSQTSFLFDRSLDLCFLLSHSIRCSENSTGSTSKIHLKFIHSNTCIVWPLHLISCIRPASSKTIVEFTEIYWNWILCINR
jgi:hypothetical protein